MQLVLMFLGGAMIGVAVGWMVSVERFKNKPVWRNVYMREAKPSDWGK